MTNELKFHVSGENQTLTVLHGKALDPVAPEKYCFTGTITAVTDYLLRRNHSTQSDLQKVDNNYAVVVVSNEKKKISLLLNPNDKYGTEIHGELDTSDELDIFQINSNKQFSREELVRLIRFNRRFFPNKELHEKLLEAYMKLNITGNTSIKNETDSRGNRDLAFKKEINSSNIPTEFLLELPIFKGLQSERFRVEIALDVTDASVRFWFESVELVELVEQRWTEIKTEILSQCSFLPILTK